MNIKLRRPAWLGRGRGKLATAGIIAAGIAVGGIGFGATADAKVQARCVVGGQPTVCYPLDRNSVASGQVVDNSLISNDLHPSVRAAIKAGQDPKGQVTELESDGPYPGETDLGKLPGQGDNSDEKVPAGGADAKPVQLWVQCAPGKVALGGGFRLGADQDPSVGGSLHVLASEPTQIADGKVVVVPIEGDPAQSIEPNGWLVEVVNTGSSVAIVRPWVTCAKVAK